MAGERTVKPSAPAVRDATLADVPGLTLCYSKADHRERIRTADGRMFRYLVVEVDGQVVGFGRLVLAQPVHRRPMPCLPWISNLNVREDMRSRGLGGLLIQAMERLAQAAGHRTLYIGAHQDNLRALSLYRRLGYEPVAPQPRQRSSELSGSQTARDSAHGPVIYLMKSLAQPAGVAQS